MGKKDFLILAVALGLAAVLVFGQFFGSAITTGAWGLSFREAGQPPTGHASVEQLKKLQPDTLTPIEAMSLLYELKKKLS